MLAHPYAKRTALSCAALLAVALTTPAAQAQLYSWKDTEGNVTIKNSPPPWYREAERTRGPRVQVLRDGKVVDDTAWPLEKRQEGRDQTARQDAAARAAAAAAAIEAQAQAETKAKEERPGLLPNAIKALQVIQAIQK